MTSCVRFGLSLLIGSLVISDGVARQNDVPDQEGATQRVLVVVGAAGAPEYGKQFDAWATAWRTVLASQADLDWAVLDESSQLEGTDDRQRVLNWLASTPAKTERLWVILLGHGTDDRRVSKFNLRGPDLSAAELGAALAKVKCPQVIVNCASSSGAFIGKLKADDRVIVTATKSGAQYNFARFGGFFAQAIADRSLDLDKDEQTSLFEAFVAASRKTQDFYDTENRLATEQALLDDNGDGKGTPGIWFVGTRAQRKAVDAPLDGAYSNQIFLVKRGGELRWSEEQRAKRDQLVEAVESLRQRKARMGENEYFDSLEAILVELAALTRQVEDVPAKPREKAEPVMPPKTEKAEGAKPSTGDSECDVVESSRGGE